MLLNSIDWCNQEFNGHTYASQQTVTAEHLPITPTILLKLKEHWTPHKSDRDIVTYVMGSSFTLLLCYSYPGRSLSHHLCTSFDASKHLIWGDIAMDSIDNPHMLKLCTSKTDQLGKGADMYVGKTDWPSVH